ncbi:MAG: FAD-dependent oxidoreductase [Armatimonadota bacterium]
MRVAIVGAGVSGLAAAYRLRQLGREVVVFEKSGGLGGRVNSRQHKLGYTFDVGATSITPRGKTIERIMLEALSGGDLIKVEKPIWTHTGLRTAPGSSSKNSTSRYTYQNGIQTFANRLGDGTDIRLKTDVLEIARQGDHYQLVGEAFDSVILTPPIPQTCQLLWSLGESRPVANVSYRSCVSVMLGYQAEVDTPYHALIDVEQVHPLTWLSVESAKSPGRAPEGGSTFVAQLSARFSQQNYSQPDEFFIDAVTSFLKHLYGAGFDSPEVAMVKKWKYSQPESLARFENVNPPGSTLLVASDGLMGGHIEDAFECGWRAAEMVG